MTPTRISTTANTQTNATPTICQVLESLDPEVVPANALDVTVAVEVAVVAVVPPNPVLLPPGTEGEPVIPGTKVPEVIALPEREDADLTALVMLAVPVALLAPVSSPPSPRIPVSIAVVVGIRNAGVLLDVDVVEWDVWARG